MYENYRFLRWHSPMSEVRNLFMDSLHDHAAGLEIDLSEWLDGTQVAQFKVTFAKYAAYRNIQEEYRLEMWRRRDETSDPRAIGWTFTVPDSPWLREFANEPVLGLIAPDIVHYVIATQNDVIEVLAVGEPSVGLMGAK